MKTSVPTVVPLSELRWQVATLMDLALKSGNKSHIREAIWYLRQLYEAYLKPAFNDGKLRPPELLEVTRVSIERLEAKYGEGELGELSREAASKIAGA